MKLLVVSDTHNRYENIQLLKSYADEIDLVIHLGDCIEDVAEIKRVLNKDVINVKGNCDTYSSYPSDRLENISGKNIFMTHGDKYNVKSNMNSLIYRAVENNAEIVLFGHTHIPYHEIIDNIHFINPGSISKPVLSKKSFCILEIIDEKIAVKLVSVG